MLAIPRSSLPNLIAVLALLCVPATTQQVHPGGTHRAATLARRLPPPPPDPSTLAPALDMSAATELGAATSFLHAGADPIQQGVAPGTIVRERAAVLRGRVVDRAGTPMPSATVRVAGRIEFGQTLTRADGAYDLAVNGGGTLVVHVSRPESLDVQRCVDVPWQEFVHVPEIVLTPLDPVVTSVDLSAPVAVQVARSSVCTDTSGSRQSTLLFTQGTSATLALPGGGTQPITGLSVRATEFTVGARGRDAMPGDLPPTSGYTYAVEFTTDEALAAGATRVEFSAPVLSYTENFLGFPAGTAIPVGYYDAARSAWIPEPNGIVLRILSISGGLADLDVTGSGTPSTPAQLSALGITSDERSSLATLYSAGQSLWRVRVNHFSPFDFNLPVGLPSDATGPPNGEGQRRRRSGGCTVGGSILRPDRQTLGERIPIAGTPYALVYQSDRVPGGAAERSLTIEVTSSTPPQSLLSATVEIDVAGQHQQQAFAPTANQTLDFTWDGKDAYGRALQGLQPCRVRVRYLYNLTFGAPAAGPASFGLPPSNFTVIGATDRAQGELQEEYVVQLGTWDARSAGLGGWTIDRHHVYEPTSRRLNLGTGETTLAGEVDVQALASIVTPATLTTPYGVAHGPDGTLYIADRGASRVFRRAVDGTISVFAGGGTPADNLGDGLPATQALILAPEDVDVDAFGRVYIADHNGHRIRRVGLDGIITTVAGSGPVGFTLGAYGGDEGPATAARMNRPRSIALDASGGFYVAEWQSNYVRYVDPAGIIHTVAGNGSTTFSGDGGAARLAGVVRPTGVAVHPDGGYFIVDQQTDRIRFVGIDGRIRTVAGNGTLGSAGDGGPATAAQLFDPSQAFVARDGALLIADMNNHKIRRVGSDGVIRTLVGTGMTCPNPASACGDGGLAMLATLNAPRGVALAPDGSLTIADSATERIRSMVPTSPGLSVTDILVPSADATAVHVFDADGRHRSTRDALTGAIRVTFGHDAAGRLTSITDESGNVTTIARDASGTPSAIVAPRGQSTGLLLDANGWLERIVHPDMAEHRATYSPLGSLLTWRDPLGNTAAFTYDSQGRLIQDLDAAGHAQTLARTPLAGGSSVSLTSALGRTRVYSTERLVAGLQRQMTVMPGGAQSELLLGSDGSETIAFPEGSVEVSRIATDPRFGLMAPIDAAETFTTPGGRVRTIARTRAAVLSNPLDPLSLITHTSTQSINGRTTSTVYTASTRTLLTTGPAGRLHTRIFDTLGRLTSFQSGGLAAGVQAYDGFGRRVGLTLGTGPSARSWTWSWNAQGWLAGEVDPLGRVTDYEYDAAGRRTRTVLPDGNEIQQTFDTAGRVLTVTPPGRPAHVFGHTPVNLLASYTAPDLGLGGTTTSRVHDGDRALTGLTRPGGASLAFGFDPTGLLSTVSMSEATLALDYEGALPCCSLTERLIGFVRTPTAGAATSLAFAYDGFLPLTETLTGPVSGGVQRTFDDDFRLASEAVNSTASVGYTYDADGLPTSIGALALTRHSQHGLVVASAQGGLTTTHAYNAFGELLETHALFAASELFGFVLTRDALGRVTQKVETVQGTSTTYEYLYDLRGRLIEARRNGSTLATYTYDANGNRTSRTDAQGTLIGTFDAQDRLLAWGAVTFQHAPSGERILRNESGQSTQYQYDALGNLVGVTLTGGTQVAYGLASWTRAVAKTIGGLPVRGLLYRDGLQPAAELDPSNTVVSRFVYSPEERVPVYMQRGGNGYRLLTDHLGSPRLVVDVATGIVAQRLDYDEFGVVTLDTNPGFQPFGFAGGLYDPDTSLVRFGWRQYDAATGRFMSKDPLVFGGGDTNLYAYARNDPQNFTDPDGLSSGLAACAARAWSALQSALGIGQRGDTGAAGGNTGVRG